MNRLGKRLAKSTTSLIIFETMRTRSSAVIRAIFFIFCFQTAICSYSQDTKEYFFGGDLEFKRYHHAYGLSLQSIGFGGEGSNAYPTMNLTYGPYISLAHSGKTHLIFQPEVSIGYYLIEPDGWGSAIRIGRLNPGLNVALKAYHRGSLNGFNFGLRSGAEGALGLIGIVAGYDRFLNFNRNLGVDLNIQASFGSFTEGYVGLRFYYLGW